MPISLKQEALEFTTRLQELYLRQRDLNELLNLMDDRISWIGTGENEVSSNLFEARQALEKEFAEYDGSLRVIEETLESVPLSDTLCIVYGHLLILPDYSELEQQNLRLTLICERTATGMKLVHCNLSRPDYVQGNENYYVSRRTRGDNDALRDELEMRERKLKILTQNIPGGVHQCANDPNLTLLNMSDSFLSMFGYTKKEIEELFDNQFINMIYPGDRAEMLRSTHEQLKHDRNIELEYRVLCKGGRTPWILDKGRLVNDNDGKPCFYCILIEIEDRKKEQEVLRLSLERHKVIMDQATDVIFEWDILADSLNFSPNWTKKFGYVPLNQNINELLPHSSNIHPDDIGALTKIMQQIAAGIPYSETEFRIRDSKNDYSWSRVRATAQFNVDGRAIKAVGVIVDIKEEKRVQQELLDMAQKDSLTGLYNKGAIQNLVEHQMMDDNRCGVQALAIIDIDNFKLVNDTYGHLRGDSLLSNIADTLKNYFLDSALVGRIGGDEFLLYLPEVTDETDIKNKMDGLLRAVEGVSSELNQKRISCSIGIALFPRGTHDYLDMYKCADQALYYRKNQGKRGVTFYNPELYLDAPLSDPLHTAVSASIDSDLLNIGNPQLAHYTFQMLYYSSDIQTTINQLLEIVGRSYDVSRVYIFENSKDDKCCNNTFEWCARGISPEINRLQNISYEHDLNGYLDNFGNDGVFYCDDIAILHSCLYNILAPQGVYSLLQCAIMDGNKFKGYIGFDECRQNRTWTEQQIASLSLIANVLSIFLTNLHLREQVEEKESK